MASSFLEATLGGQATQQVTVTDPLVHARGALSSSEAPRRSKRPCLGFPACRDLGTYTVTPCKVRAMLLGGEGVSRLGEQSNFQMQWEKQELRL